MRPELRKGLIALDVPPSASVVDLGCGTGNLTLALLEHLDSQGRIVAVDLSPIMIDVAKRKVSDDRVRWAVADAVSMPRGRRQCGPCDLLFGLAPLPRTRARREGDPPRLEAAAACSPFGMQSPKEAVNAIHRDASPAVETDLLAPRGRRRGHARAGRAFPSWTKSMTTIAI